MRMEWKDDQLFLQMILICGGAVSLRYRCVLCGETKSGLFIYGFRRRFLTPRLCCRELREIDFPAAFIF